MDSFDPSGKQAPVTDSGQGIGLAPARAFGRHDVHGIVPHTVAKGMAAVFPAGDAIGFAGGYTLYVGGGIAASIRRI
ncbi:MAG: hypothetical protein AAF982_02835 [Pseudomonadota bacterium]